TATVERVVGNPGRPGVRPGRGQRYRPRAGRNRTCSGRYAARSPTRPACSTPATCPGSRCSNSSPARTSTSPRPRGTRVPDHVIDDVVELAGQLGHVPREQPRLVGVAAAEVHRPAQAILSPGALADPLPTGIRRVGLDRGTHLSPVVQLPLTYSPPIVHIPP